MRISDVNPQACISASLSLSNHAFFDTPSIYLASNHSGLDEPRGTRTVRK
jgi:hypothetical protein